jgi:phospholipid/cholesterol/gamma-HCH transport system substrate-binding protein
MRPTRKSNIRLGIYIASGVLLFIVIIYFIGRQQHMFQRNLKITAIFSDVRGLNVGANVRFTGIDVGTVSKMIILSDTSVRIEMAINDKVTPFIKRNSMATIATEGLMGSKIVVLMPGSPDERSIINGDNLSTMPAVDIDDIIKEIKTSSEKISAVSSNLVDITNKVNRGEGIFGKIFTDTTIAYNIGMSSRNLEQISARINRGEGLVGRLFADTSLAADIDSASFLLEQITRNIQGITHNVNRGQGVVGRLLTDTSLINHIYLATENLNNSTANLEKFSANLIDITDKMNAGPGVFNKLLIDSVFADSLDIIVNNLNKTIIEVKEASEALQRSGFIRAFSKKPKEEGK